MDFSRQIKLIRAIISCIPIFYKTLQNQCYPDLLNLITSVSNQSGGERKLPS